MFNRTTYETVQADLDKALARIAEMLPRLAEVEVMVMDLRRQMDDNAERLDLIPSVNGETSSPDYLASDLSAANRTLRFMNVTHSADEDTCVDFMRRARNIRQMAQRQTDNECDVPVRSQIGAWMLFNASSITGTEWTATAFYDELRRFADTQPAPINWRLRETDELAFKWMDLAWENVRKTFAGFPF